MPVTTIAFTSCARFKPAQAQTGWQDILAADPDYLVLLGDQIYMDFGVWPFSSEYLGKPKKYPVEQFARIMRQKYQRQWSEPNFARLLMHMRAKNGLLGVWDDHDFGWNNAYGQDPTLPSQVHLADKVATAKALFHEFMNCAPQPPEIYGCIDTPQTRLILLDNRSYATPLDVAHPVLMGTAQMAFLSKHLQHERRYTLICGGLTLSHSSECWCNYTTEFNQFQHMLTQTKSRVIYLGGDIHQNAFTAPSANGRPPCFEIISSGICVNYLGLPFEFDRRRNWTLLEIEATEVRVHQHDKHGTTRYRIDAASGQFEPLGRTLR